MAFVKDLMLSPARDLPSPSIAVTLTSTSTNPAAFSPNTEERIIDECGGIQTMCDLDFDLELDPANFGENDDFINENFYAREMSHMKTSPSGFSMPDSPIDVTADCPTPSCELVEPKRKVKKETEYQCFYIDEPTTKVLRKAHLETPYMGSIDLTPKPRGRPPKQVADTKRAQLAKNWRLRKQEEENQKSERLRMYESRLADSQNTIDMLTQENEELKQKLKKHAHTSKGNPYDRRLIIKTEEENKKFRRENAELSAKYDTLFQEFQELKTIMQGVMWSSSSKDF